MLAVLLVFETRKRYVLAFCPGIYRGPKFWLIRFRIDTWKPHFWSECKFSRFLTIPTDCPLPFFLAFTIWKPLKSAQNYSLHKIAAMRCIEKSQTAFMRSIFSGADITLTLPVPNKSTKPVQMRRKRVMAEVRRGVLSSIAKNPVITPNNMRSPKNTATAITLYVFHAFSVFAL